MPKMKMLKDWDYAEKGYIVHNYKKGKVYEVDERCVELCDELKCGEKVSEKATTEEEAEIKKAKEDADKLAAEEAAKEKK